MSIPSPRCVSRENGVEAVPVGEAPYLDAARSLIEDAVVEVSTNPYVDVESATGVHLPCGVGSSLPRGSPPVVRANVPAAGGQEDYCDVAGEKTSSNKEAAREGN